MGEICIHGQNVTSERMFSKIWAALIVFINILIARSTNAQDGQVYPKLSNGSLIPFVNYAAQAPGTSPWRFEMAMSEYSSRVPACSSRTDCDFPGCSDRGHAWECGELQAEWSVCLFWAAPNHTDFCINLCTKALSQGQTHEYPASFCPLKKDADSSNQVMFFTIHN
jgi:hypothetical protein